MVGLTRTGLLAGLLFGLVPYAASAQTAGDGNSKSGKSERGMPDKGEAGGSKSERAMPDQTRDSGTPPAKSERAMPAPEKK